MVTGALARTTGRRRFVLPVLAAVLPLGAAIAAGLALGEGSNSGVSRILGFSSASTNKLGSASDFLGVGFAFAAGMLATVNPCGFVMLPAYLGLYVGDSEGENAPSWASRLGKALYVSAAVGLGFVLLFGITGFSISAGARSLGTVFPWIGLGVGVGMSILGAYMLGGGKIYSNMATRAASRIGDPRDASLRGYFLFGVSYAITSLSCTLPIFLGLITSSLATGGIIAATGQFLSYALGMASVITALTIGVAVFKGALVGTVRRAMPYVQPVSAAVLVLVGGYLVFYWLTEGGLAGKIL